MVAVKKKIVNELFNGWSDWGAYKVVRSSRYVSRKSFHQ